MKLVRNIDLVQIPIVAGTEEYSLPRNVDWAEKSIDKILLCAPDNACVSPIDGVSNVYTKSDVQDLYLDMYDNAGNTIFYEAHYENVLYTNNHALEINAQLDLQLCKLRFTTAPVSNGVLLLYVFWNTQEDEWIDEPRRSKTIAAYLPASGKIKFSELLYQFIHADGKAVRGLQIWNAENTPCYITLRDHELKHILNSVHCVMCKPPMAGNSADDCQYTPIRFDSLDIDFDYSFIQNATSSAETVIMTFEY